MALSVGSRLVHYDVTVLIGEGGMGQALVAVVAAMLFAVPSLFHAQPAPFEPTGPFAGAVVNHFGVVVGDVDQAAPLYAELFGVTRPTPREFQPILFPDDFAGDRDAHPRFVMLQLGGSGMEVMTPVGGPSPWREFFEQYGEGMQHITFTVRNTLEAVAHLKALGGRHELGAVEGVGYAYVNFRDQLGFTIELGQGGASGITSPPGPLAIPTSLGTSSVRHLGIVVSNVDKAAALFSQVLGIDAPQSTSDSRTKRVVFPMNVSIEFIEPVGGASPWSNHLAKYGPSIHHVAVSVDDVQRYSRYLEGKGAARSDGTFEGSAYFDLRPQYALGIELHPR